MQFGHKGSTIEIACCQLRCSWCYLNTSVVRIVLLSLEVSLALGYLSNTKNDSTV
jgi:hypothetical protein